MPDPPSSVTFAAYNDPNLFAPSGTVDLWLQAMDSINPDIFAAQIIGSLDNVTGLVQEHCTRINTYYDDEMKVHRAIPKQFPTLVDKQRATQAIHTRAEIFLGIAGELQPIKTVLKENFVYRNIGPKMFDRLAAKLYGRAGPGRYETAENPGYGIANLTVGRCSGLGNSIRQAIVAYQGALKEFGDIIDKINATGRDMGKDVDNFEVVNGEDPSGGTDFGKKSNFGNGDNNLAPQWYR